MDQASSKVIGRGLASRGSADHSAPSLTTRMSLDTRVSDTTTPPLRLSQLNYKQGKPASATQTPRGTQEDVPTWPQVVPLPGPHHNPPSSSVSPYLALAQKKGRAPSRQSAPDRWTLIRPARSEDPSSDALPAATALHSLSVSSHSNVSPAGSRVDRLMNAYGVTSMKSVTTASGRLNSPNAAASSGAFSRSVSRGRVASPSSESPWSTAARASPALADTRSYSLTQRTPSMARGTTFASPWGARDSLTSRPHSRAESFGTAGHSLASKARGLSPPWLHEHQQPSYQQLAELHSHAMGGSGIVSRTKMSPHLPVHPWTNATNSSTRDPPQQHSFCPVTDSDSDNGSYSEFMHGEDPLAVNDDGFSGVGRPIPVIVTRGTEVVDTLDLASEGSQGSSVETEPNEYDYEVGSETSATLRDEPLRASGVGAGALREQQPRSVARPASQASAHTGPAAGVFVDLVGSMSYEDIPVVDQGLDNGQEEGYGMTLDEFMARMTTTPASHAATSGLGELNDEVACVPCATEDASHVAGPHAPLEDKPAAFLDSRRSSPTRQPDFGLLVSGPTSSAAGLDLRPATAATLARPDSASGRKHDLEGHHGTAPIKQVDLGSLPRALFTPSPSHPTPQSAAAGRISTGAQGLLGAPRADAWAPGRGHVDLSHGAAHTLKGVTAVSRASPSGPGAFQRPLSSTRRGVADSGPSLLDNGKWVRAKNIVGGTEDWLEADRASVAAAAAAALVRPTGPTPGGTRLVQSARPVRDGAPVDPGVWRDRISVQLERPPSRQRPPPQALHLWTPLEGVPEQGGQASSTGHRTAGHRRPQSAAPTAVASSGQKSPFKLQGTRAMHNAQGASDAAIMGSRQQGQRQATVRAAW